LTAMLNIQTGSVCNLTHSQYTSWFEPGLYQVGKFTYHGK